jgi:hypothetical protein
MADPVPVLEAMGTGSLLGDNRMSEVEQPQDMPGRVAQAICIGAVQRKWPNADMDFVMRRATTQWQEYLPDAMLVIEVINNLVAAEQFADAVQNLPQAPEWATAQ